MREALGLALGTIGPAAGIAAEILGALLSDHDGTVQTSGPSMKPIDVPIIVVLGAPNDERGKLLPVAEGRALTSCRP